MKFNVLLLFFASSLFFFNACSDDDAVTPPETNQTLQEYLDNNNSFAQSRVLYACAAGNENNFLDNAEKPVSVFFYPFDGAEEYKYFESFPGITDTSDYKQYGELILEGKAVFNGKLHRFLKPGHAEDRFGIISYKIGNVLHFSEPIRIQPAAAPTLDVNNTVNVVADGIQPEFTWSDSTVTNNAIYFSVITELNGDFIAGVYTYDLNWKFYDTSNVVLNVTDESSMPVLESGKEYRYTLMGVDDENWVHTFAQKNFVTE